MAQQSSVALSSSKPYREFEVKEPATHVDGAVVEAKAAQAVEKELPLAFEEEVAALVEEPGAMAAEALKAPIEERTVVEEREVATTVEELAVEIQSAATAKEIVVEEVAAHAEEAEIELEAGPVVQALSVVVNSKHKVFLSHSGEQKAFVERLCVALEGCYLHPFFDKRDHSLPIGKNFVDLIFDAIKECRVGVVVLSAKFFTSKWPMMELVAMMEESRRRNFTIIPVYYSISLKEFGDPKNRNEWLLEWHKLAKNNPMRVQVEKWEATLKELRPINGLVYDGLSELSLEKEIVDKICNIVPPEIRLGDKHMQGKEHLCKVIQDKIDALHDIQTNGICTIGLYGMGGMGKTSICKVLCNNFFNKFHGKVCHAELGKKSDEELMREVVKKLTGTSNERLNEFNVDQLCNLLKEGITREAIFLDVDNMSDTAASIKQAKSYLSASLPAGSIVMVTARSKDLLRKLRPYIDDSKCLEMPELKVEHAEVLFAKSSDFEPRNDKDKQLLKCCIQQCYFRKGDGNKCSHYHPLALDVLGRHLGCMDPKEWWSELRKIDRIGKHRRNPPVDCAGEDYNSTVYDSIFSILRTSFDTLSQCDQVLFMDVALFFPNARSPRSHVEWIGVVHGIPRTEDVMRALGRLKSKSLLESVGDGIKASIGMHDLWRAFCVAETKYGELGYQRWVYEAEKAGELVENSTPMSCWENVKRIAFLGCKLESLERVNFGHFPNVRVLKITGVCMTKEIVVDLSGLIHLKSLEVVGRHLQRLVLQGLPRGLIYLILASDRDKVVSGLDGLNESNSSRHPITQVWGFRGIREHRRFNSRQLIEQIECLQDLQILCLTGYGGGKLPDIESMVSMRVAKFDGYKNVVTLTGLSSTLTNLRSLSFKWCRKLRSCLGLDDLVYLEVLRFEGCRELKTLPNLRKLRNLRVLNILKCPLIVEVPGLGELVSLTHLYAGEEYFFWDNVKSSYRLKLPDIHKLRNLQVLSLRECRLKAMPGFHTLTSLQRVEADFREVEERSSLGQLTKLEMLRICGWSSKELGELNSLVMLQILNIVHCSGVDELPDLQSLISLQWLYIEECEFKDVSGLSKLTALKYLHVKKCSKLERLPDLQRLTGLEEVWIRSCPMARGWDCTLGQDEFTMLGKLTLWDCNNFDDLTSIQAFSQLETFECSLPVSELPDLSNFPRLKTLWISSCRSLTSLTCREPMNALSELKVEYCSSLVTIPDLRNFPGLLKLMIRDFERITPFGSVSLTALQELDLCYSSGLKALPDLGMFPALEKLLLRRCGELMTLSCSVPLTALQTLNLRNSCGLKSLPDLGMFPALEQLWLKGCGELMTLRSSVPLPALKELDARECRSLSWDDLDQLQALCPQCKIKYPLEKTWRSRLLGCSRR